MKTCKKIFAVILIAAMILAIGVTAFAADTPNGKITITNAEIGRTYKLYKLLDETVSGNNRAYYVDFADPMFALITSEDGAKIFTVKKVGETNTYSVSFKEEDKATAEAFLVAAIQDLITAKTATPVKTTAVTAGNTVVWDGLELGYYYVDTASEEGVIITVDGSGDVKIIDKTLDEPTPPTPEDPEDPTDPDRFKSVKDDFVAVGGVAEFTIKFTATNFVTEQDEETDEFTSTQVVSYKVVDTPVKMAVVVDSKTSAPVVTVKVGSATLAATQYTAVVGDKGVLTVTIPWVNGDGASIYANDSIVTVAYSAKVTDLGASNKAVASYKLKGVDGDNDIVVPEKQDEVTIKNGSVTVDANVAGGYYKLVDGTGAAISLYKIKDGEFRPAVDTETAYTGKLEDGSVVKGLDSGKYTVEELSAPSGYNIAGDVDVTIDAENKPDVEAEFTYNAGTVLPETGGIGTVLFIMMGAIAVLGAGIVLVTNKRMSKEVI